MRILADTHVVLWWLTDNAALSLGVRDALADADNQVFVSSISVAEIAIKASLGKLEAPDDVATTVASEGFDPLPFTSEHAQILRRLPWHHRDPFDRMLVAQAQYERLAVATNDARLRAYDVPLL